MAVANPVQSLQEEATCSVCLEYYTDPVTTDCGHNFCRPCITKCWERDDAGFSCPQCRHVFPQKILRPNRQLINIVTLVQQLPQPSVRPQEESLCDKHNEKLMLFCREDQKVICLVCKESRDHRTHTIQPIEEAAQEYKLTCLNWLDPLKKEMENITKCMSVLKSTAKALRNNLETERQKIIAEFEHLRQLLNKQERILRGQLEEVERKITATETENVSKLSAEFSSLKSLIEEIEEKCKQKDGDFLKDVRSTLRRCEGNKRKRSFSSNVGAHTKQARIEPNDSEIALGNVPLKNLVDRMKTYKESSREGKRTNRIRERAAPDHAAGFKNPRHLERHSQNYWIETTLSKGMREGPVTTEMKGETQIVIDATNLPTPDTPSLSIVYRLLKQTHPSAHPHSPFWTL